MVSVFHAVCVWALAFGLASGVTKAGEGLTHTLYQTHLRFLAEACKLCRKPTVPEHDIKQFGCYGLKARNLSYTQCVNSSKHFQMPGGKCACEADALHRGHGQNWGVPKIKGTPLEVPIIRTIVFWGLYWGPLLLGNYQLCSGGTGATGAKSTKWRERVRDFYSMLI